MGRLSDAACQKKHGRRDLNPQQAVLETAALPIELLPYASEGNKKPDDMPSKNKLKGVLGRKFPRPRDRGNTQQSQSR